MAEAYKPYAIWQPPRATPILAKPCTILSNFAIGSGRPKGDV